MFIDMFAVGGEFSSRRGVAEDIGMFSASMFDDVLRVGGAFASQWGGKDAIDILDDTLWDLLARDVLRGGNVDLPITVSRC